MYSIIEQQDYSLIVYTTVIMKPQSMGIFIPLLSNKITAYEDKTA
jgi:hypothetical protein